MSIFYTEACRLASIIRYHTNSKDMFQSESSLLLVKVVLPID